MTNAQTEEAAGYRRGVEDSISAIEVEAEKAEALSVMEGGMFTLYAQALRNLASDLRRKLGQG